MHMHTPLVALWIGKHCHKPCVCIHVHVHVSAHVYVEARGQLQVLFLRHQSPCFLKEYLLLAWNCQVG